MKTYYITYIETRALTTAIEAENELEAEESFISQHEDGEWEGYFGVISNEMQIEEQTDNENETDNKGGNDDV